MRHLGFGLGDVYEEAERMDAVGEDYYNGLIHYKYYKADRVADCPCGNCKKAEGD